MHTSSSQNAVREGSLIALRQCWTDLSGPNDIWLYGTTLHIIAIAKNKLNVKKCHHTLIRSHWTCLCEPPPLSLVTAVTRKRGGGGCGLIRTMTCDALPFNANFEWLAIWTLGVRVEVRHEVLVSLLRQSLVHRRCGIGWWVHSYLVHVILNK